MPARQPLTTVCQLTTSMAWVTPRSARAWTKVSVQAVVGDRLLTATLQGEWPDTTDDAKVAAGTELVRTVISRLAT